MALQWDPKIGLASVIGAAQLALVAGGGVLFVDRMQSGVDVLKAQVEEQRQITRELRNEIEVQRNRLTATETTMSYVKDTLLRIERKVEARP